MQRRTFLLSTAAAGLAPGSSTLAGPDHNPPGPHGGFHLKYAPHFGMFGEHAGDDPLDQLKFAADQGFTAWEDNGMIGRPVTVQERIAGTMQKLGMEMGVISALRGVWNGVNFAGEDRAARNAILEAMQRAVEVAKRVGARHMTVVPGLSDPRLPADYQTANCIELLRRCCDVVEPHGLVMVIEPLNTLTDHPGVLLSTSPHAHLICRTINRPSCKILFDIYHQQITEGNLIPNIDHCWDQIGYFQCGDNPGRNEPGTGEINYANVFAHVYGNGYRGVIGMEHGNSLSGREGEQAVIDAYGRVDSHIGRTS